MSKKTFNPTDWAKANKAESKAIAKNKPVQSINSAPPLGEAHRVQILKQLPNE